MTKAIKLSGAAIGVMLLAAALVWNKRGNAPIRRGMSEHDKTKEVKMFTLAGAEQFCNTNAKKLDGKKHKRCRCGDGRYFYSETLAPIARFGADAGYFAVVLAAVNDLSLLAHKSPLTERQAHAILKTMIEAMGGPAEVCFHTDDGHGPEAGSGCGFLNQLRQRPSDYHLTLALVKVIDSTLKELRSRGAHEETLHGNHLERALILVKGNAINLVPRNANDDEVFVYTEDSDKDELRRFARILVNQTGFSESALSDSFVSISDMQTELTRVALANDRPVYVLEGSIGKLHLSQLQ